jgi:uncharacterized protein YndB with AHSA1/START domain
MEKSNTQDRELLLTRVLDAPVELVWEAWSQAEHLAQWWGPNGFTNTIEKMEFQPGGAFDMVMHGPDGTDYVNKSVFREVVLHKRIIYEQTTWPHILATIEFQAQGDKTHLRWHMLFASAEVLREAAIKHKAGEGLKQTTEKFNTFVKNMKA